MRLQKPHYRYAFAAALCLLAMGCRSMSHRQPTQAAIADGREFSREGIAALETGRYLEAETLLQQAVNAVPNDPDSRRYLAEALWQRQSAAEAIRQIEVAHSLSPDDPAIAVRAGQMQLDVGQSDRALVRAERAIRLDPQLADAWALRGRARWQAKDSDQALADMQRALQYSPGASDLLIDMAKLYYERGESQRCLTTLHRILDAHPPGEEPLEAVVLEGRAYLRMGLPFQASESFASAKSRSAPTADLCCLLAEAEIAAGRPEAALAAAQEAVSLDASHVASREIMAKLAAVSGETVLR
jgi:tetratricopeptide (TPR) repeat protein